MFSIFIKYCCLTLSSELLYLTIALIAVGHGIRSFPHRTKLNSQLKQRHSCGLSKRPTFPNNRFTLSSTGRCIFKS